MQVDGETMGRKIAEARDRVGVTQAGLASTIGIDRSALAKIESGTRRVSALELARIADALGERIEWFVMETPEAIVSHRNLADPGQESPQIDRLVAKIAWNVEFVVDHCENLKFDSIEHLDRPINKDEAEKAAVTARLMLGLEPGQPFYDIAATVQKIGLLCFSFDLGKDSADAASILLRHGGVAVINGNLHVGRRRLALVHELGHFLFADEYTVDWRVLEKSDDDAWESRLDRFARAVLLPAKAIKEQWESLLKSGDGLRVAAIRVASKYRVDMTTLALRLTDLGVIGQSDFSAIRAARTTRADIVDLNLVTSDELAPPFMNRAYEEAILKLYRQEVVSSARATDLLFDEWQEDDLPELQQAPESAVWKFV
ncbi:helix-turn-helix domain-containing protein [Amycolatopsis oliviviridis]|nr:XRE family transcriptional regulator [Amycolatopsis oliviviridis]